MATRNPRKAKVGAAPQDQSQPDPLRLDLQNKVVWKGTKHLKLRPREFAVLRCLLERAGELVTKEALYEVVWQAENVIVGDDALTTSIYEIRRALGEKTKTPSYIETRHKYGYRFVGPLAALSAPVQSSTFQVPGFPPPSVSDLEQDSAPAAQLETLNLKPETFLVGRETELQQLHSWLEKALSGERQMVFVTGEAGIGKTTLVRAFLRQVAAAGNAAIGRGQCIEHYGPGEAYLPVLEAIGRLCRDPRGAFLIEWMKQHAPTWLVQMSALLSPTELEELQRKVQGAARERMLREMSEALERLTQQTPLILVLEDLHWSDVSTLDLLAAVARRQESARLLVIGTYRPEEGFTEGHPLRAMMQELRGHGLCQDLALTPLSETAVDEYVRQRLPAGALPARLPQMLHRITGGNPLFLVAVVDDLIERGVLAQADDNWVFQGNIDNVTAEAPESIRQLIGKQVERLNAEERHLLQAASLVGIEFSTAAVAAATEVAVAEVEEHCATLAQRQQFLQPAGLSSWPDGVQAARYRFRHALYQYLWNERVTPHQRPQLHQKIGERLEAAYGNRAGEIAAELAVHFEQGRDYLRALHYHQYAAANAMQRQAYQEAIAHITTGLNFLTALPNEAERTQQELMLRSTLGPALMATRGFAAAEVEGVYARALELCRQIGEVPQLFPILRGLQVFHLVRAELPIAHELASQMLRLAQHEQNPSSLIWAHADVGTTLFWLGQLPETHQHLESAISLYDLQKHPSYIIPFGLDPGAVSVSYLALLLCLLGRHNQALQRSHEALTLTQEINHPFSEAHTRSLLVGIRQLRREPQATQTQAATAIQLSQKQGFPFYLAQATILYGWALAMQEQTEEGIKQIHQGLMVFQATGADIGKPYHLALLAEAYQQAGQVQEGLRTVNEGLVSIHKSSERNFEAELYRLKGELTLQKFQTSGSKFQVPKNQNSKSKSQKVKIPSPQSALPPPQAEAEAEEYLLKALDIARQQSAKLLELRAAMSVSRLWRQQGKKDRARQVLTESYSWFTEGVDTADLQEAKALIDELS